MIKILEKLRKNAFWSIDALKGGGVKKHYREIQLVLNNPNSDEARYIRHKNLSNILEHTIKTVPFYYDIPLNLAQLEQFPVINKQIVREKFEHFRSLDYKNRHMHEVSTSGSTGKPFKILHDGNKRDRNTADTIFFAERAGFELGSRLYYLRLWDKQYKKNWLLSLLQNISMHSVDNLSDHNVAKLISALEKDKSNKNLLAYTSALDSICKYLDKNQKDFGQRKFKVNSVIAIAEALGSDVKNKVLEYFGTEVVSRYSNSENGILAQQKINGQTGNFEINWASYHIEILDLNHDRPVDPGEPGRIVITDLFNYSMPLIRYDTGDVGVLQQDPEHHTVSFARIEGRKMDMFTNTKGEYVSSHIIHHILQFKGIEQFQFVEEENGIYIIKLKVSERLDDRSERTLHDRYMEYFGEDAKIKIKYVDDIPLLPSGKRKLVINNAIAKQRNLVKKTQEMDKLDLVN